MYIKSKIIIKLIVILSVIFICALGYKGYNKTQDVYTFAQMHKSLNNEYLDSLLNTKFNQLIINASESLAVQKKIYDNFTCQDNHFLKVYIDSWRKLAYKIGDNPLSRRIINDYKDIVINDNLKCKATPTTQEYINFMLKYQDAPTYQHLASLMSCKTVYYYVYNTIMTSAEMHKNYDKLSQDLQDFISLYGEISKINSLDSLHILLYENIALNSNQAILEYRRIYKQGLMLERDFFNNNYFY